MSLAQECTNRWMEQNREATNSPKNIWALDILEVALWVSGGNRFSTNDMGQLDIFKEK